MKHLFDAAVLVLSLFAAGVCSPKPVALSATIDSLTGKAEIRRAGAESWIPGNRGDRLGNNDLIRVLDKSGARIRFGDGAYAHVKAGSQVLINLFENPRRRTVSQHVTIFFGAVFFVVKAALPEFVTGGHDLKVFTPTAVIATRGTSFLVTAERETGRTTVGVLNGTVLVRNILKNESIFLRAGNQTVVGLNADPSTPGALVDENISSLRTWVALPLITREMKTQNAKSRRDYEVITGNLEERILIIPFTNGSEYTGTWDIGTGIAGYLAKSIDGAAQLPSTVLGESREVEPFSAAVESRARLVMTGTVEEFDITQHARISASADEYGEYNTGRTRIRLQLIDVETKKLLFETSFPGEVTVRNRPEHTWEVLGKLSFDMDDPRMRSSIIGKSVAQACNAAMEELGRYTMRR